MMLNVPWNLLALSQRGNTPKERYLVWEFGMISKNCITAANPSIRMQHVLIRPSKHFELVILRGGHWIIFLLWYFKWRLPSMLNSWASSAACYAHGGLVNLTAMRISKPDVKDMVAIGFTPQKLRILVILCRVGDPFGNPINVETLPLGGWSKITE